MFGQITGMRIIVSKFAYKTKTVLRGITDSRRPNRVKPLYRRVVIHIPLMYKIGNDIVCAPEIEARIRQDFKQKFSPDHVHEFVTSDVCACGVTRKQLVERSSKH